jgi:hypothetical protein
MSITGITPSPLPTVGSLTRADGARANTNATGTGARANTGVANATAQSSANANALKPQAPIAGQATQTSVPAEAPAGTDPALWSVLTNEERNFFAKSAALGPLTYGRLKEAIAPAPAATARGVRLDVRA